MGNLCIIPARGGSKRIPRKNIKNFLGKPIIAYSIEVALKSDLFEEVMVSTDDKEIAKIAEKYGAVVPFIRSENTSDDFATTADVLLEVIANYRKVSKEFKYACCIYPTAPLINIDKLVMGYELLISKNLNSIFPVVQCGHPVFRGFKRDSEGITSFIWPEFEKTRSQDLEPVYHDAGQWYWFDTDFLSVNKKLVGGKTATIILAETEAQDIDTLMDWELAKLKYKLRDEFKEL
jgi:pseudaminic acid cytidylyltransferase